MTDLLERLNEISAVRGITWEWAGGGYPVQAEGRTTEGQPAFFRFRHNSAQLYIGEDRMDPILYAEINDVFSVNGVTDSLLGELDDDQFVDLMGRLVAALAGMEKWPEGTRVKVFTDILRASMTEWLPHPEGPNADTNPDDYGLLQ